MRLPWWRHLLVHSSDNQDLSGSVNIVKAWWRIRSADCRKWLIEIGEGEERKATAAERLKNGQYPETTDGKVFHVYDIYNYTYTGRAGHKYRTTCYGIYDFNPPEARPSIVNVNVSIEWASQLAGWYLMPWLLFSANNRSPDSQMFMDLFQRW